MTARRDEPHALGRAGGDWHGLRPSIDNPFTWSVTVARFGGLTVRMHGLFLLFIAIMMLSAWVGAARGQTAAPVDPPIMAVAMGCLVLVVLAHELGHALACRWVGGVADELLLWPLGGLAWCAPPPRWGAHLAVALGGPAVNVLLCALAGGMLAALTGQGMAVALPNIIRPLEGLSDPEVARSWAHITLYLLNEISLIIMIFNLVPMFPFDGGRIVQAALWRGLGYSKSMRATVVMGYVAAVALAIFGAVVGPWGLALVAAFGVFVCYTTQQQVEWSDQTAALESEVEGMSEIPEPEPQEMAATASATRQERAGGGGGAQRPLAADAEAAAVDRILAKIADKGLASLSVDERALLQRATERRREEKSTSQ